MKVKLHQKVLAKRVQGISAVLPSRTSLPILSTFLMEAKEGKVYLTANDLEVSLTTIIACEVGGEGDVAVPGKKFTEIVRSLPEELVEISSEGEKLSISCGKSRFKVLGRSADEFPKLPEQEPIASFTMDTKLLDDMIAKTIYAVSSDLTRPPMCGVLWEVKGGSFIMVATDGHRLSKVEHKGELKNLDNKEFIVSPKALNILRSLIDEREEVNISLTENHITFDVGDSIIYSRLLEGPFPDYDQVIPKQNKKELVVNREEFTDACRRVSILASTFTHQVKMSIQADSLKLSVNTPDLGEAEEEVHCSFNSDPMDIGYNARYLLDMLKTMKTEDVSFLLDRNDNASMLVPVAGDERIIYQCLLMPLRLGDRD